MTRTCSKCGQDKPLDTGFHKNAMYKGGYYRQCKECRKKHPSQTPQKVLDRVYQTRMRNQQFLIDFYESHACVDCGEGDPIVLELDHVRGEKVAGVSELVHNTRSLDVIREEIAKCEVVCANCHRRRTARTQGWLKAVNDG